MWGRSFRIWGSSGLGGRRSPRRRLCGARLLSTSFLEGHPSDLGRGVAMSTGLKLGGGGVGFQSVLKKRARQTSLIRLSKCTCSCSFSKCIHSNFPILQIPARLAQTTEELVNGARQMFTFSPN